LYISLSNKPVAINKSQIFLVPIHGARIPFQVEKEALLLAVGFIKTKHISGFTSQPPKLIDFNKQPPKLIDFNKQSPYIN